jgi:hypothetical protein
LGLDIETPRGQAALQWERRAASVFEQMFPGFSYVETPKEQPAAVDAVIVRNGVITAVLEMKCRDTTLLNFHRAFEGQWLVTFDKLLRSSEAADRLSVPLIGGLYLIKDDHLLVKRLYEPERGWVCDMAIRRSDTQRTINGGVANRSNAFIDMREAKSSRSLLEGGSDG